MSELTDFLRQRNIDEETITKLVDNKIDHQVLLKMDDSDLKTYLPAHGDRIAVYAFCKSLESPIERETASGSTVATRLLDRIRGKIGHKRQLNCDSRGPNANAKKTSRRLELGWMDFDVQKMAFKQVRSTNGGGTRHLTIPKDMSRNEIIDIGKNLFFPDGLSTKGSVTEFSFSLRDFQLRDTGELSVCDLYEKTKVKMLRLYLCTEMKQDSDDVSTANTSKTTDSVIVIDESDSDSLPDILSTKPDVDTTSDLTNGGTAGVSSDSREHPSDTEGESGTPTITFNRGAARQRRLHLSRPAEMVEEQAHSHAEGQSVDTAQSEELLTTPTEVQIQIPSSPSKHLQELHKGLQELSDTLVEEEEITVRRGHLMDDVLQLYQSPLLPTKNIKVKFCGESGDDFGGLTKDMFTNVWKEIIQSYFPGEAAVVPFLPLHRLREEKETYVVIGRILAHTAALLKSIPPRLSRCVLLSLVFGEDAVGEILLLEDFLLYLTANDRFLLSKALQDFGRLTQKEIIDVVDFFSINNLQEQPKATKIRQQILSIAQDVMVDKPARFITKMRQGIPQSHMDVFWSLLTQDGVTHLFNLQRPTTSKLLENIHTTEPNLHMEEEKSLHFFKQYVASLDQEDLSDLLVFVTGSTVLPDVFNITFRNVTGVQRCPIAHTCSNTLELPSSYSSVQELKREFRAVLSNPYSFEMSML